MTNKVNNLKTKLKKLRDNPHDLEENKYKPCVYQHGLEEWCQDCIAEPKLRSIRLPDGTTTQGYIMGNETEELLEELNAYSTSK